MKRLRTVYRISGRPDPDILQANIEDGWISPANAKSLLASPAVYGDRATAEGDAMKLGYADWRGAVVASKVPARRPVSKRWVS